MHVCTVLYAAFFCQAVTWITISLSARVAQNVRENLQFDGLILYGCRPKSGQQDLIRIQEGPLNECPSMTVLSLKCLLYKCLPLMGIIYMKCLVKVRDWQTFFPDTIYYFCHWLTLVDIFNAGKTLTFPMDGSTRVLVFLLKTSSCMPMTSKAGS